MRVLKGLQVCTALFICLLGQFAAAESNEVFYMGFESGELEVARDDYETADAASLLAGFAENDYIIQLNAYAFDDIKRVENETAYSQLEGYSIQVGKEFKLLFFNMSLAYGRFWWDVRNFEDDAQVSKESGADKLLEAQLFINIGAARLYVTRKEFSKVAGDDIDFAMFGVQYAFK